MTADERTPDADAPAEQSGAEAPAEQSSMQTPADDTAASEPPNEADITKSLLMQVGIVGGIIFLVALAVFFGLI